MVVAEFWWTVENRIVLAAELASRGLLTGGVQNDLVLHPWKLQPEWDHFQAVGDLKFFEGIDA